MTEATHTTVTGKSASQMQAMPLTMTSLEIAALTGKRHDNVLRDADAMLAEIGSGGGLSFEGTYLTAQGKEARCLNLPQRECMILVSGYSVPMRAAIVDRWQALEAVVSAQMIGLPPEMVETLRRMDGICRMLSHKVAGLERTVPAIAAEMMPAMVREHVAEQQHSVVRGVSAGQVLAMAGLGHRKGLRGMAPWLSHRLRRFHAEKGVAVRMASLGSSQAYVFDSMTARQWLDEGGRAEIEQKAAERRGQGALTLIQGYRS